MYLSREDMRIKAVKFAKDHENSKRENSEAQTFLNNFFDVFGVDRRRYATFEKKVNSNQRIDLLWKQKILIEMKSRGENLDKAYSQAKDYFQNLADEDIPNLIMVCDMQKFRVYDLENNKQWNFTLSELEKNIDIFSTLYGGISTPITPQDPVNIKAAEKMGKLHNEMDKAGYTGHQLEVYMVRLMFCMFAEDTGIFEPATFFEYIKNSKENGEDLASRLHQLFEILNKPETKRSKILPDELKNFPYINGDLFTEGFEVSSFNSSMRKTLLECCSVNWEKVSPAIFGSMFQSIMDKEHRRDLGAHYTSEANIIKVIKPLFLDELYSEFEKIGSDKKKLQAFQIKLRGLHFLDPACGCGNFLVIAYREIRRLEHEVIKKIYKGQNTVFADGYVLVNVEQFYGIEIEEFPARIAQVAMWLLDHQMNKEIGDYYGEHFARIPLKTSAKISNSNALTINWKDFCLNADYILGNPPFVGAAMANETQQKEKVLVFDNLTMGIGKLDYVTCWYKKAADYIEETKVKGKSVKCAFVSTNSICQGEQAGVLWGLLFENYKIHINFAYQTFKWSNEAKGKAAVSCIIVGFSQINNKDKRIFTKNGDVINAKNINQYLLNADNITIKKRSKHLNTSVLIERGNIAYDWGFLTLSEKEAKELTTQHNDLKIYIKVFINGYNILNNKKQYCLWLKDYRGIENLTPIKDRVEKVFNARNNSKNLQMKKLAETPTLFGDDRQPKDTYIAIPRTIKLVRYYPFEIYNKDVIVVDAYTIAPVDYYTLGVIGSRWHIIWLDKIGGRLGNNYRYSVNIVYNNFPFPEKPTDVEKEVVVSAIKEVIAVREELLSSGGGKHRKAI